MKRPHSRDARYTSFRLTRPGILPGFRVKPHLERLDTMYVVACVVGRATYLVCAFVFADYYIKMHRPNAWRVDVTKDIADVITVSASIVFGYLIAANLLRYFIKTALSWSGWYSRDELREFPIDTTGRVWDLRIPKGPTRQWPAAWQEADEGELFPTEF